MIRKLTPENRQPYDRPNDRTSKVMVKSGEHDSPIYVQQSSLRFNRKKFTVAVTGFVIGAVLILMQSPFRNQLISPGELSSAHAQIIASETGEQCSACHDAGKQNFSQWISSMFRSGKKVQACQSQLCMKCHAQSINEEFATNPHNISPDKLKLMTENHESQFVSFKSSFDPPIDAMGNIECSSCHREHHGQSDLTAMTDQQCQTCHASTFGSFESDHPEFKNWPPKRRQRIAFDHTSHSFKHFPGMNTSFECSACHVDDRFQSVKLLANYEATCAQCHQQDIAGSIEPGVQLLAMPMLDLDAIAAEKLDVGRWPTNATGDFDGRIPELMRLLLFKDQYARKILEKHGSDFEFGDFDPDDAVDVDEAVQLAWSIKYLIYDLASGGETELRNRLEFAFQRPISEDECQVLTGGLSSSVFAEAANSWLPGLAREVPDHRARRVNVSDVAVAMGARSAFRYFKDDDPGLLTKNPLTGLMGVKPKINSAGDFENSGEAHSSTPVESEELAANDLQLLESNCPQEQPANNWLTNEPEEGNVNRSDPVFEDSVVVDGNAKESVSNAVVDIPEEQLLATNPLTKFSDLQANPRAPQHSSGDLRNAASNSGMPAAQPVTEQQLTIKRQPFSPVDDAQLLATNPLSLQGPSQTSESNLNSRSPIENALPDNKQQQIAREFADRVADTKESEQISDVPIEDQFQIESDGSEKYVSSAQKTGWFRNDDLYQISYRPKGHADVFLSTMMEVVGSTKEIENNPAVLPYFNKMTSESSVGSCNDCHTLDRVDQQIEVNWKAQYRDPLIRSFTRFSHGAHLTQSQLKDCVSCHSIEQTHLNADTFKHFDASDSISNFASITKSNCTSCHFEGSADNSCTQCHNYHIGSRVLMRDN